MDERMLMAIDLPTINKSRDNGDLQDMYRRALAASWASTTAELPADQCVEDIFNGGNGWKDKKREDHVPPLADDHSASDEHLQRHHHRSESGASIKSQSTITTKNKNFNRIGGHKHSNSQDTLSALPGAQTPQHDSSENSSERGRTGFRKANEVDEFEVRDDLVAWRLPTEV
jgi:hypothetical protein